MKFLIRDDDTCAMTRPEELVDCYEGIWGEIPINLSVTPFRIPGEYLGVPEALYGSATPIPLEENAELVRLLRELVRDGRVHVALHGYHHERVDGQPEFIAGAELRRKAQHGKDYLESLLDCTVDTFVPPNNGIGPAGYAAVVAARLNLLSHPGFRVRAELPLWLQAVDAVYAAGYRIGRGGSAASRFIVYRFPSARQAGYTTVGPEGALPPLLEELDACAGVDGNFVLATHYHAFPRPMQSGETVAEAIHVLIDRARSLPGVRFTSYRGLW